MSNFSNQTAVSDGTLLTLIVGIEFFSQGEISVFLDDIPLVAPVDYVWTSPTSTTIEFPTPIPNGGVVRLQRATDIANMRHVFTAGAQFNNQSLDEDYEQILRIVQEVREGFGFTDLFNDLDMHDFRIKNLGDGVDPGDAVTINQLQTEVANSPALARMVRVPAGDPVIPTLPVVASRANKLLGFSVTGDPVAVGTVAGDASSLAIDLADYLTVGKGGAMVGLKTPSGAARTVADITDTASPALGAGLIGRAGQVVSSIAALKLLLKDSPSKHAFATGFYAQGDGGGGEYWLDVADVTSVEIPGILVVAADGGRWKLAQRGAVSVRQFGVKADLFDAPTRTINDAALLAARNWAAAGSVRNHLLFTAGVYAYNTSPNWAIQNLVVTTEGEVRLRYFGTGNAVIIDHGATPGTYLFNVRMETFIVEAPNTALNGVYVRSIHHSKLCFKVRGAGTNYAGMQIEFAVCTDFSGSSCYPNDDGNWYLLAKPKYGLSCAARGTGESVSYCMFTNTIWEGLDNVAGGAGILLDGTLGNIFQGGTAERCNHGVITTANAINNRFYGIDFEANIARDILEQGQGNEYHGIDSATLTTVGATALFPKFFGGSFETIEIATGARLSLFDGCSVNRFGTVGGGFVNGEPSSMFRGCIDLQTQKITPALQGAVAVGVSPFNYVNNTGNDAMVALSGGAGVSLIYNRAGIDVNLQQTFGTFHLSPGDTLRITYTGVPTVYYWQK